MCRECPLVSLTFRCGGEAFITGNVLANPSVMERRVHPRPQRIFLAEDSADLRQRWSMWLTIWGFSVVEAQNGQEAVEKARVTDPDLIMMDIAMPVLDGIRATELLKADPVTAQVPVLAVSANVFPPTPSDALAAGCDVFVPKPLDPDNLIDHLRSALRRTHRGHSRPTEGA